MIKYLLLLPLFFMVSCDNQEGQIKTVTQYRYEIELKNDTPYFLSCESEDYWIQGNVKEGKGGIVCQPKQQVQAVLENLKGQGEKGD
jgi:P pilus assembly chaperone PapD